MADAPYSLEEIEEQLDIHLDPVLSSRRTAAGPARGLALFTREQQNFVLSWVEIISRSNSEMAYQFAVFAPKALESLEDSLIEKWVVQVMDVYDRTGLYAAIDAIKAVDGFIQRENEKITGFPLEEIIGMLEIFVRGLAGRALKIEFNQQAFTDTESLFLPEIITAFPDRQGNFDLYKAMSVYLWAQNWFGTFRRDIQQYCDRFSDPHKALAHWQTLERLRLNHCIAKELPGVYRVIERLSERTGVALVPDGWEPWSRALAQANASVEDSLSLIRQVYNSPVNAVLCYQGEMQLQKVQAVRNERLARDKALLQSIIAQLEQDAKPDEARALAHAGKPAKINPLDDNMHLDEMEFEMQIVGQAIKPPEDAQGLIRSIMQDLGEIPDEYLFAAGDGGYRLSKEKEEKSKDVWAGTYHEEGAFLYNEWDYKRRHYRKNWCVLREMDVVPKSEDFVKATLVKYAGFVKSLRNTFEIFRGDDKILRKQAMGDDIDIDAMVEGFGDMAHGLEVSDRMFRRRHKVERNIAVMFMVDMSGSTDGWINEAERESLVLLAESLETLGDQYAIYGFSGMTRKRCEIFRVKRFDEPYTLAVKQRIAGIKPQDYTRMGVAIRHLTELLRQVEARTKILITLSDGKPDDYDSYRGTYGIEDTRQSLIEAKRDGIHSFCITIDKEGEDYLPHMYGPANYILIDEVRKLPLKVSDIYRKLTS